MKFTGMKYNLLLIIITIVFTIVDIFLMVNYGFSGQLLILLYTMIGIIPLCSIIAIITGMSSPTILIDNCTRKISANFIANDRYKSNHNLRNQFTEIYFDEIIDCHKDKNNLIFKMKYDQNKTLYLYFFTKKQIESIKKEINKIM